MLILKISGPLALWASTVAAFYPYVTADHCKEVGGCLGPYIGELTTGSSLPTIKISQRRSMHDLPHHIRISQYLHRLTRKNQRSVTISGRNSNYTIQASNSPSFPNSVAIDQDGADFSYFATMNFGSQSVPLHMLLDTGASDTWVMGTSCTSAACSTHDIFDGGSSSSFEAHAESFAIGYGTGSVSGMWASDTISVANLKSTFAFGVANQTSKEFLNYPFDGILGLSTAGESTYPAFMTALQSANLLKANILAVNLNRNSDGTTDGELTFGAIDSSKFTGSVNYISLTDNSGKWVVKCDSIIVGSQATGLSNNDAFIDTGTSYMFMPPADASTLHGLVKNSSLSSDGNYWLVPCQGQSTIELTFNGATYAIPPKDWVGPPKSDVVGFCVSNIYPGTPAGAGTWLLGDTFLKNVYSVFDYDQKRIGFGLKTPLSASAVASSVTLSSLPSLAASPTTSLGTSGGFDAAVTSTSSSPYSASETASSPPSAAKGVGARLEISFLAITLSLLASFAVRH